LVVLDFVQEDGFNQHEAKLNHKEKKWLKRIRWI
jgi:hypothetical protein